MSDFTDFESNILRLLIVALRFQAIHHEFPNQMSLTKDKMLVRAMLREYAIIQLHNFLKIRKDLLKNIEFKNLDDVIKPLIQPILDNENGIGKMRHNYIAHIQEEGRNFRIMMNDIVLEYNLPTDWASWSYFSGLAWYYYSLVDVNFKEQMDKAMELYEAKVGQPITNTLGFKMDEVISKMNDVFLPISLALDQHGLKTTFSTEDLELVKKKLQTK